MTLAVSEEALQSAVIDIAHKLGWRITHFRPARTADGSWRTAVQGDKGFPDNIMVRGTRTVVAELKSERGRLEPAQAAWLQALAQAGIEVYVWRPSHWQSGEIETTLARGQSRLVTEEDQVATK